MTPTRIAPVAASAARSERQAATPDTTVPLPGPPGYALSGRVSGRCLVAPVWAVGPPSVAVCTIGVAAHSHEYEHGEPTEREDPYVDVVGPAY